MLGLQWGDIDLENLTVKIQRSVADGEANETKAEASQATLPLDPDLAELLLAHKARSIYPGESDFVFARPDGKPPWPDSIIADHLQPARSTGRIGRVGRSPSLSIVCT